MMQHAAPELGMPLLRATHGFAPHGMVWVENAPHQDHLAARVSARFSPQELRRCVAAGLPALVMVTQCNTAVIIDFICAHSENAQVTKQNVLTCDAIELGGGQARLWTEGRTLHIRAHHIDVMAEGEQRLRGATVHVG